jgi:hypothetical protein
MKLHCRLITGKGVFLANGDSSIVLATNQQIASEFNSLSFAVWLLTTYTLAQCSSQPLVRLSSCFPSGGSSNYPAVRQAERHLREEAKSRILLDYICARVYDHVC